MSLLSRSERTVRLPLLPYIFVTFSLSYPTLPSDSYLTVLFNGPVFLLLLFDRWCRNRSGHICIQAKDHCCCCCWTSYLQRSLPYATVSSSFVSFVWCEKTELMREEEGVMWVPHVISSRVSFFFSFFPLPFVMLIIITIRKRWGGTRVENEIVWLSLCILLSWNCILRIQSNGCALSWSIQSWSA